MATATATKTPEKPAQKSAHVLIWYDTKVRERGVFSETSFTTSAEVPKEDGKGVKTVTLHLKTPGVQKVTRAEWELWQKARDEGHPAIAAMFNAGALRLASDEVDVAKIQGWAGKEIIKNTFDVELLAEWAKSYNEMDEGMRNTMKDKEASMKTEGKPAEYVFGSRVG